jgi:uncharacterized repeat protein (TIGR01451 family)
MFGSGKSRVMLAVVCVVLATAFLGCECLVCDKKGTVSTHLEDKVKALEAELAAMKDTSKPMPATSMGALLIKRHGPKQVNKGQEYEYTIDVINHTGGAVKNVEVSEDIPPQLSFLSASPDPVNEGPPVKWRLTELDKGETETLKVRVRATETGSFRVCAVATYETPRCAMFKVVAPELALKKMAPEEVLICDVIPLQFEVENPGTGVAEDVRIKDQLPNGLVTKDGQRMVTLDVGDLKAGQSRKLSVMAKAQKTGTYENSATASGAGGLEAESNTTTTMVRQPVLKISKSGPSKRFLGQKFSYEIKIQNTGDAAAQNTVVKDKVPAHTKFVSASDGGTLLLDTVTWKLGTLDPDESKNLELRLSASGTGTARNTAVANADCADEVSASAETELSGIPAILLEVIDISDPIEVGNEETYVITATNQGTLDDENVQMVVTMEDEMQFVSASGPTDETVDGKKITFAPLDSLAPKKKATWRVKVKAVNPGDVRLKVQMTSDMLKRPVEETEATHFYE